MGTQERGRGHRPADRFTEERRDLERGTPRRRFRPRGAVNPMKKIFLGIGIFLLASVGAVAEIQTGGYLSFSFLKGQAMSGVSQGSFQDVRGGALATGDLGQGFSFLVEARFRSESTFDLEQALAGFKLGASGDLRLGLFLVPFGKYNESNRPQQTVLVATPLNLEAALPRELARYRAHGPGPDRVPALLPPILRTGSGRRGAPRPANRSGTSTRTKPRADGSDSSSVRVSRSELPIIRESTTGRARSVSSSKGPT